MQLERAQCLCQDSLTRAAKAPHHPAVNPVEARKEESVLRSVGYRRSRPAALVTPVIQSYLAEIKCLERFANTVSSRVHGVGTR